MSLTILHRRRILQGAVNSDEPVFLYDTSGQFSANETDVFVVERSSDGVIAEFSAEDIANGNYTTWLNGASGYLRGWKDEKGNFTNAANTGNIILNSNGINISSVSPYQNLSASFNEEITDFTMAMVINNIQSTANQRYQFGVWGANSGAMMYVINSQSSTYRKGDVEFVWKTETGTINRKKFTSNYSDALKNVVVMEVVNNVPRFIVNGTEFTAFTDSTEDWGWSEVGISKVVLGNRSNPTSMQGNHFHFSLRKDPTKTAEEISNELISIYQ